MARGPSANGSTPPAPQVYANRAKVSTTANIFLMKVSIRNAEKARH